MKTTEQSYSLRVIADALGMSYRATAEWCEAGPKRLIQVESTGTGKGRRVKLSLWDVLTLSLAADLRKQGVPLQRVRRALSTLREKMPGLLDRVLVEALTKGDAPRTYLLVKKDHRGRVDVVLEDLDDERLVSLVEQAGQLGLYVRNVEQAARHAHGELEKAVQREAKRPKGRPGRKPKVTV